MRTSFQSMMDQKPTQHVLYPTYQTIIVIISTKPQPQRHHNAIQIKCRDQTHLISPTHQQQSVSNDNHFPLKYNLSRDAQWYNSVSIFVFKYSVDHLILI